MRRPQVLPDAIEVHLTELDEAWEQMEVFEALHHLMAICNPLDSAQLETVIGAIEPRRGESALDIACGHGELLIRLAGRGVEGVGVDISPWALRRAHHRAEQAGVVSQIRWRLQDGAQVGDEGFDITSCLGASWIFDGTAGTIEALAARSRRIVVLGDLVAVGDPPPAVTEAFGDLPDEAEVTALFQRAGLTVTSTIATGPRAWNGYQARIEESARAYAAAHPGPRTEEYLAEQRAWRESHAAALGSVAWMVWVAVAR